MMDSVPVVFITGQVRTDLLGTDGFQEADTMGITMPAVKHSWMIQHPLEIPRVAARGLPRRAHRPPRPGRRRHPDRPVAGGHPVRAGHRRHLPGYQPTIEGNTKQIRQAAKALAAARRPVIYVGGGVAATRLGRADRARPRRAASRSPAR